MKTFRFAFGAAVLVPALLQAEDYPPTKLGLTTQIVSTGFKFEPLEGGTELRYRPAQSNYAGLILGYRWAGTTVTFAVPATDEVVRAEGTSQYADYRFSLYWQKLGIEAGYNSYKRYLIENSQPYVILPELKSAGFGINVMWALRDGSYGLDAAIDQSAWQQESGGSWIVLASWRQQELSNTGVIIPNDKQSSFGEDAGLSEVTMGSYAVGGGYGYNYVNGNFFIAPLIAATVGLQHMNYVVAGVRKSNGKEAFNGHVRLTFGFNARGYFATINAYADVFTREMKSIRMSTLVQGVALNAGLRF